MKRQAILLAAAALFPIYAAAQSRTFVSSAGLDTNPCTRTSPCRGFNAAVAAAASGGEVIVLDSAGYGPATISKAISIVCPVGVYAGITVNSGDGFVLDAPGGIINLKGLTFTNLGGIIGIVQNSTPAQVNIDSCSFSNFIGANNGAVDLFGAVLLTVRDTEVRNNSFGILVNGIGAAVSIDNCRFDQNGSGVSITDGEAVVRDSVFFGGGTGVAVSSTGAVPIVTVERCLLSKMTTGLSAGSFMNMFIPAVRVSNTTIVDTSTAMSGVQFISLGNNHFAGNTSDGTFGATIPPK